MKKGKFLSIALAMLLALTTLFAACDCNNTEGPEGGNTGKQGIHGGTVEETNDYIVKGGKSDYVVVYDKESTDNFIPTAKNAFINFFREATKVVLPEKDDSEVSASNDLKAIVIGQNAISQAAGLTNEYYSKSEQSFQIKTVGKTIYVLGAKYGVVYGAYELLNYLFGFKYYTEYCYDLDKGVTDEKLCNYNISEVPDLNDITMNVLGLVTTTQDPYYKNGLRITNRGSFGWGGGVHNSYDNVPPTKDLVINKGLINPFTNKEFDPENGVHGRIIEFSVFKYGYQIDFLRLVPEEF